MFADQTFQIRKLMFRDDSDGSGQLEDGGAAAVAPAACFEPKMADTMFPKTLIFSS